MNMRNWTRSTLLGIAAALAAGCGDGPAEEEVPAEPVGSAKSGVEIRQLGDVKLERCGRAQAMFEIATNEELIDFISVDAAEVLDSKMKVDLFAIDAQGEEIRVETASLHSTKVSNETEDLAAHEALARTDSTLERHETSEKSGSSQRDVDRTLTRSEYTATDATSSSERRADSFDLARENVDARASTSASHEAAEAAKAAERVEVEEASRKAAASFLSELVSGGGGLSSGGLGIASGVGWDFAKDIEKATFTAAARRAAAARSEAKTRSSESLSADALEISKDSASANESDTFSSEHAIDIAETVSISESSEFATAEELDLERTNSTLKKEASLAKSRSKSSAELLDRAAARSAEKAFSTSKVSFDQLESSSVRKYLLTVTFESLEKMLDSEWETVQSTGNIRLLAGLQDLILADAVFPTVLPICH